MIVERISYDVTELQNFVSKFFLWKVFIRVQWHSIELSKR